MSTKIPIEFFELLNRYPSPLNTQPIRLEQTDTGVYTIFFDRSRGLNATEKSYLTNFITMGVFVQHALESARAYGVEASYVATLPKEAKLRGIGEIAFGTLKLTPASGTGDVATKIALRLRRTSRLPYEKAVPPSLVPALKTTALHAGMKLDRLVPSQAKESRWLNYHALIENMTHQPYHAELSHWLRSTEREKKQKRDGIAADALGLSASQLHDLLRRPAQLNKKLSSAPLKRNFLRAATDASDVFYLEAPLDSEQAAFNAGLVIMQLWHKVALVGCSLEPLGSIMQNDRALKDFLHILKKDDDSIAFIFRAGFSKPPKESLRIPLQTHLLHESDTH